MKDFFTYYDAEWDFMNESPNGTNDRWGMNSADNGGYPFLSIQGYENDWPKLPDGNGSEANPWEISTIQHLLWLSMHDDAWGGSDYIIQTADIDASDTQNWFDGAGFLPVGNADQKFMGEYDGAGYSISNLYINRPATDNVALFGFTDQANLSDVHLVNANIVGQAKVGALVGHAHTTNVHSCSATGNVTANHQTVNNNSYAGGLIGSYVSNESSSASITSSYTDVNVDVMGDVAGGLIGLISSGFQATPGGDVLISNCYTRGSVIGQARIGGMIGRIPDWAYVPGTVEIVNCYSSTIVSGNSLVGGLIGDRGTGTLTSSFWDTDVSGQSSSAGGTGMITADMKHAQYFYEAGWDFAGETQNGSDDIWGLNNNKNNGYPFLMWQGFANTDYCVFAGSGTEADPYQVSSLNHLRELSSLASIWDDHFIQTADIDATGTQSDPFVPIGNGTNKFEGSYDGNGFQITNLNIDRNADYNGLFGYALNSTITNIHLVDVEIDGNNYTGTLIGYGNNVHVTKCSATGNLHGDNYVGGLIGFTRYTGSNGSYVSECWTNVRVFSYTQYAGGLIGFIVNGDSQVSTTFTIENCYARGWVQSTNYTGGLIGYILVESYQTASVKNCFSAGRVVCSFSNYGGLIGYKTPTCDVLNCFWDMTNSYTNSSNGGTGKTASEMFDLATYTDLSTDGLTTAWDFVCNPNDDTGNDDIWVMNPPIYPVFSWQEVPPVVATIEATNITTNSAEAGGMVGYARVDAPVARTASASKEVPQTRNQQKSFKQVTTKDRADVTARGVCWSTSANPTLEDFYTVDGSGLGSFTSTLTGLSEGTIYYYRAYATSVNGTGYGEEYSFVTLFSPADNEFPANGATGLPRQVTVSWRFSGSAELTGFKVYKGETQVGDPVPVWNFGENTQYNMAMPLADWGETVTWKIVPYNDNGDCTAPVVWSYTTMDEPAEPDQVPTEIVYASLEGVSVTNPSPIFFPSIILEEFGFQPTLTYGFGTAPSNATIGGIVRDLPTHLLPHSEFCTVAFTADIPSGIQTLIELFYSYTLHSNELAWWNGSSWQDITISSGADFSTPGTVVFTWTSTGRGTDEFVVNNGDGTTLPVEMSSFTATVTSQNYSKINWTTQSESDMAGYNLYRTDENSLEDALKINLDIIPAANATEATSYEFLDQDVTKDAQYFYWLESVELGGGSSMHGPVTVTITEDGGSGDTPEITFSTKFTGTYPNPFNPVTTISYTLEANRTVRFSMFDLKGRKVGSLSQHGEKGRNTLTWNAKDLPSGIYFIRMNAGDVEQVRKVMILK